jgi:hypothetical protein
MLLECPEGTLQRRDLIKLGIRVSKLLTSRCGFIYNRTAIIVADRMSL